MERKKVLKHISVATFLVVASIFAFNNSDSANEKLITVIFRCDDYSSRSSIEIEERLIEDFKKYKIPVVFGVIPFVSALDFEDLSIQDHVPLSPRKRKMLYDAYKAGVVEIALHGHSHQTILSASEGGFTEFSGLGKFAQMEKIMEGKNFLDNRFGIEVETFIPPWNSYDKNTLKVLAEAGFKCISADASGYADASSPLRFLPATVTLQYLRTAVKAARGLDDDRPIVMVYFHANSFKDINDRGDLTYSEFQDILEWITSQTDVRVKTISQVLEEFDGLDARRFIGYRSYQYSFYLFPPFLRPVGKLVYFSSNDNYGSHILFWIIVTISYYCALLLASALMFILTPLTSLHRSSFASVLSRYGILVTLVFALIYVLHDLKLDYRGASLIAVLSGVCVGIWAAFLKKDASDSNRQNVKDSLKN